MATDDIDIDSLMTERSVAEVIAFETDEVAKSAHGAEIETYSGRRYLDFTSGVAVHACGQTHPEIVDAIARQAALFTHTADVTRHTPQLQLAHEIRRLLQQATGGTDPWTTLLLNSGSESVDAAAKLALKVTGRRRFLSFAGAFHGRTLFATALSNSKRLHLDAYERFLEPLRDRVHHVGPPPGIDDERMEGRAREILSLYGKDTAAVILEPIQGEGGYRPFTRDAATAIAQAARDEGALVIVDEVQTGFGRTGRWFGFQHLGLVPDIVVFGKSIGGGMPLAGVSATDALMRLWEPGEHGTTFGGNPVSCAAGLAALAIIERDDLVAAAAAKGAYAQDRLRRLQHRGVVSDVRGHGLMIGVELRRPDGTPDWTRCQAVKAEARENGLLVMTCGMRIDSPAWDTAALRLMPALNIDDQDLERGLDILESALEHAKGTP
jgi:4-aminobutyrate aminotransferase